MGVEVTKQAADFWRGTLALVLRHLTTMLIIFSLLSAFAQPWAEDFIRDTVAQEKFATQRSLEGIESRTAKLEKRLARIEQELNAQSVAQARTERDLEFLKLLQQEERKDTKHILERLGIPN